MEISVYLIFNVMGQHDWQDERLTGQLPNQSRQCPLTSHYFESCEPLVSLTEEKKHLSRVFNILKIHHHICINIVIISQIAKAEHSTYLLISNTRSWTRELPKQSEKSFQQKLIILFSKKIFFFAIT